MNKEFLQYYYEFLTAMTEKEIKARYKHALLGFLWVILNPLFQMLIIGFVFQFFVPFKMDNYFLFLFSGLLSWNFLSSTISKNTPMIVHERHLIQKAKFPREIIILSIVLSNLFHFAVSLGLLLIVLFIFDLIVFPQIFLLPIAVIWITTLTTGLSLFFSALNVRFRDINFIVQAGLPLWFYATPIVYTLKIIPQHLQILFYLNPATSIIELFQLSLLNKPLTSLSLFFISVGVTLFLFLLGIIVFAKESPYFDDWV